MLYAPERFSRYTVDLPEGKLSRLFSSSQECTFDKLDASTYLHVAYHGALRIWGCNDCCRRWFFTFNGAECTVPAAVDGLVFHARNNNIHRVATVEGYCGGVGSGRVRVEFHVGNCRGCSGGDAQTGWNTVSRIVIQEVPAPVQ